MIVRHELIPGVRLIMRAYTFNNLEFLPLENVIRKSTGQLFGVDISRDEEGRNGRKYEIKHISVPPLEQYLDVRFFTDRIESGDEGESYCCKELKVLGSSDKCKTFRAKDLERAKVKCSLVIAPDEGWFSGEAERGECEKKKRRFF